MSVRVTVRARSPHRRRVPSTRYCDATTTRLLAEPTVACGDVVAQVTLPAVFVQLYQVLPSRLAFTLDAFVGLTENANESMFCGFDPLSEYDTPLTV